jgi:hypothetical protein
MSKKKPQIDLAALQAKAEQDRIAKEQAARRGEANTGAVAATQRVRRAGSSREGMRTDKFTLATGAGVSIRGRG